MKKSFNTLRISSVLLIVLCLSTSASSISFSQQNSSISSAFDTQILTKTNSQKITGLLEMINETLIREYLETIVGFGPRVSGSYGCEKSAQYIYQQFMNMGLTARYQNWTAWGNIYHPHFYTSQNVEGTLTGTNTMDTSAIIFNAHYDTIATGPGANDDGSGTVGVLAAAYALSHFCFKRTIKFVTFSGEEIGLCGSRAYAKEAYERNDNILVEINADMIGHDEGIRSMRVTATEDVGWIGDIFQSINNDYSIGLTVNRGNINRVNHKMGGSDYAPFLVYGWESICCWEGDHDPNFHTAQDDLSNVNISYLVNMTRIIAATIARLADFTETPPQVRITSPRIGYLYNAGLKKRVIDEFKTTVINDIWIWAEIDYATVPIERAEFFYNGKLVFTDTEAPFKWQFNKFSLRKQEITIVVYDQLGRNSSDWREIHFINIFKKIK